MFILFEVLHYFKLNKQLENREIFEFKGCPIDFKLKKRCFYYK